mgnify:CR=1 FL=1
MENNTKKMLFFDIDGTLITEGSHILPISAREALKNVQQQGHLIFINTGRTYFNIPDYIQSIGFDGYICGCGTYIRLHDQVLLSHTIPHETCVEIVSVLRDCNVSAMFEGTDGLFFDYTRPAFGDLARIQARFGGETFQISQSWDRPDLVFDKLVIWRDSRCDFDTFYRYITKDFTYIDRGDGFGEIVPKGFSKASGIRFLQDHLNISLDQCYAFGDSANDLPMLEYVIHSVAMGNSIDGLAEKTEYVTTHIEQDGIANALRHYGIIQ